MWRARAVLRIRMHRRASVLASMRREALCDSCREYLIPKVVLRIKRLNTVVKPLCGVPHCSIDCARAFCTCIKQRNCKADCRS